MQFIRYILLVLILSSSCTSQKKTIEKVDKITYTATSRGFYQKIILENQTAWITNARNAKSVKKNISAQKWKQILKETNKIKLEDLPNFKAPTSKRFYDGAAIATFVVTKNGKETASTNFDHGFPPTEIKEIVSLILAQNKNEINDN